VFYQEVVGVLHVIGPLHPVALARTEYLRQISPKVMAGAVVVGADDEPLALAQTPR